MSKRCKSKFNIGDKVFYVDYVPYAHNGVVYPRYKNFNSYEGVADNIVLYGTITDIFNKGKSYNITMEKVKGLDLNNRAVIYAKEIRELRLRHVYEEFIFSSNNLDAAKQMAKQEHNCRLRQEKKTAQIIRKQHIEFNTLRIYEFILREYCEFNIKYSKQDIESFYKLAQSTRFKLMYENFHNDLCENVEVDYEAMERFVLDEDESYVDMLRQGLKIKQYKR